MCQTELDKTLLWQNFSLSSSCPGQTVSCLLAEPSVPLRGIVQISHGMAEHIERYRPFFRFLAAEGFVVCGNDHIGHGKAVRTAGGWDFLPKKKATSI